MKYGHGYAIDFITSRILDSPFGQPSFSLLRRLVLPSLSVTFIAEMLLLFVATATSLKAAHS